MFCSSLSKFIEKKLLHVKVWAPLIQLIFSCRNKKLLLIASHTGHLTGNALGLAVAAKATKDFVPVFIGTEVSKESLSCRIGIASFHKKSRIARLLWKIADVAAYTIYYRYDFGMGRSKAFKLFLWHGMPIKGVGAFAAPVADKPEECDLAIATSSFTADIIAKSFRIPIERVAITGEPKTDTLTNCIPAWDWIDLLKKRYHAIIAYLPTWREEVTDESTPRRGDNTAMEHLLNRLFNDVCLRKLLSKHNAAFVVRMHAFNEKTNVNFASPFYRMDQSQGEAWHLLEKADIIIGDYSSLVIDSLQFNHPLALWCDDLERFIRLRPFPYFDFQKIFGWAIKRSLPELVQWLSDRLEARPLQSEYIEDFSHCLKLFHNNPKDGSGLRILSIVRERLVNKRV